MTDLAQELHGPRSFWNRIDKVLLAIAAIAVWALVKPRIFIAYFRFALIGAAIAGTVWNAIA